MDDGDPALRLRHTWGDVLTSPPPLCLLTPPKEDGGRITLTGTGFPVASEGHTPLRGREAPPLVQRKAITLSEKEDSLSETPRRVSSDGELPIEITS